MRYDLRHALIGRAAVVSAVRKRKIWGWTMRLTRAKRRILLGVMISGGGLMACWSIALALKLVPSI
jgi:hypothetical protein